MTRSTLAWRDAVESVSPTVLVLGGFLTVPPIYRPLRARLRRRGAASVVVADVWTPHWLLAAGSGRLGPILTRSARAFRTAVEASRASSGSRGAPLLVVGVSAGGMLARLLTSDEPFDGRRYGAAPLTGAIVSLGTPHRVVGDGDIGGRIEAMAAGFAERVVPGTRFAPHVGYLAVASRSVVGRLDGTGRERVAHRLYQGLMPEPGATEIDGDGLVPVASALLAGAHQIILDGVDHGPGSGRPWYGSDEALDEWWGPAMEIWRLALRARVGAADDPSPPTDREPLSTAITYPPAGPR